MKFLEFESGRLFEVGANSRLDAYSNKYGKGSKHGSSYQG